METGKEAGFSTFGAAGEEPEGRARYSTDQRGRLTGKMGGTAENLLPSHKGDGSFLFCRSSRVRRFERRICMLDIKFLRSNPELVKENIRKKFQEEKVALVDRKSVV